MSPAGPDELIVRDIRCFEGEHRARLRPITLLVGENSTGKTTLLACYAALHRMLSGKPVADRTVFRREPFDLGLFPNIVRSGPGRGGARRGFAIGFRIDSRDDPWSPYAVTASFGEDDDEPMVTKWRYDFGDRGFIEFRRSSRGGVRYVFPGHDAEVPLPFEFLRLWFSSWVGLGEVDFPGTTPVREFAARMARREDGEAPRGAGLPLPDLPGLSAVAPLRAKPRRNYDPVEERRTAEGAHIPMLMMRLALTDPDRWRSLEERLVGLGAASGLLSEISVRSHGEEISAPFELRVRANAPAPTNLVDVGYGVSQSLPILVSPIVGDNGEAGGRDGEARPGHCFLLQQPEVHLHPRAQAELGTFFVEGVRAHGHRFLVETHSDFIVDRICTSVRKGRIGADDVSLLFFEPRGDGVTLHNIRLDEFGNRRNVPPGYRDFFLRETDDVLGIDR